MLANVTFYNDQELPTTDLIWTKPDGTSLYDFSSGWTFSLRLARVTAPATTLLLKTTGITGASTSPNLSIAWSTSDWSGLEASTNGTKYVGAVYARRTADSYDMAANISLTLKAAPGTSPVAGTAVVYPWYIGQPINAQTGTTYTLAASDRGGLVTLTNAAATTLTVSTAVALAAGERVDLVQLGAGQVTVAASGVTVNATPGLKLRAQYSAATLLCISTGVYVLVGDLSA